MGDLINRIGGNRQGRKAVGVREHHTIGGVAGERRYRADKRLVERGFDVGCGIRDQEVAGRDRSNVGIRGDDDLKTRYNGVDGVPVRGGRVRHVIGFCAPQGVEQSTVTSRMEHHLKVAGHADNRLVLQHPRHASIELELLLLDLQLGRILLHGPHVEKPDWRGGDIDPGRGPGGSLWGNEEMFKGKRHILDGDLVDI